MKKVKLGLLLVMIGVILELVFSFSNLGFQTAGAFVGLAGLVLTLVGYKICSKSGNGRFNIGFWALIFAIILSIANVAMAFVIAANEGDSNLVSTLTKVTTVVGYVVSFLEVFSYIMFIQGTREEVPAVSKLGGIILFGLIIIFIAQIVFDIFRAYNIVADISAWVTLIAGIIVSVLQVIFVIVAFIKAKK